MAKAWQAKYQQLRIEQRAVDAEIAKLEKAQQAGTLPPKDARRLIERRRRKAALIKEISDLLEKNG